MKNQIIFPLITLCAFAAGVVTFAIYQRVFVTEKISFPQTPVTVQMNTGSQNEKSDNNFVLPETNSSKTKAPNNSAPAFDELVLREARTKSELNQLLQEYLPEAQGVLNKQFELRLIQLEMARVSAMSESNGTLLTFVYGKLLIRKVDAQTRLQDVIASYGVDSPQTRQQVLRLQEIEKDISEYVPVGSKESRQF